MNWNPKDDIYKQFAMTPDQQLLRWEDWIQIREHEVVKLGFRIMRPPVDLIMNQLEQLRPNKERKITLEEVQIAAKPVIRGRLWEQAERLKQYCPCDNVYELHRTPAELGKPKIMEHIKCPDYIQKFEKGLLGEPERIVCSKLNATYEQFVAQHEQVLKDKIAKIDPHRPDMKELIVIGKRPKSPPKKEVPLPVISVSPPIAPCQEPLTGVYALRINNTIVVKNIPEKDVPALKKMQQEPGHENCYLWTYYFNVSESKIGRSKLYLENLGTVTIRYCWKKIKKMIPYIPEETYEQKFFFNKNEDVISPGQNKSIYFTFVSDKPGIYSESWELALMNISLFDNTSDKFSVNLLGDSVENMKKISRKIEKLELRIDRKAMRKFILHLLQEKVKEVTGIQHEIYPYKKWFLEAELFVAKNMQHFYHQTEVSVLKDMYKQISGYDWNLSLLTWRNAMIDKEFDERMRCYNQLKKSHRILLSPWYEGSGVLCTKYRAVKLLLGKLALQFYDEFDRVSEWNGKMKTPWERDDPKAIVPPLVEGPLTSDIIHNIFYIRMYDHVANTMEMIAGTVSSLDLNRWIEFDFCQI